MIVRGERAQDQLFLPGFGDDDLVGVGVLDRRAMLDVLPPRPALRPEDLRALLDVPFTDEQLAAATAPSEPAVIVAGAGSGKTSVMAARVVWLVATGQVAPERVLGLTFTAKAAAELSARVGSALRRLRADGGERMPGALVAARVDEDAVGEPVVCTYHAFAGRLVAEHALRLGLEPDSSVLAAAARYQLAARVVRGYDGPVVALTRATSAVVGDLVALDGELSEHLLRPADVERFEAAWSARLAAAIEAATGRPRTKGLVSQLRAMSTASQGRRELARMAARYAAARRERDLLDFGDQVRYAARLAETVPEVGAAERELAGVVLLDEYQDTSVSQRRMLAGLFGGGHPVTAVGDPCQGIYGWRGASVSNLDHFPEHFPRSGGEPAAVYELSVNQRSGGQLLRLANDVAEQLRARHRVVELRPRPEVENAGRTVVALHLSWSDEVAWVARTLRFLVDVGEATPGECAVLVRTRGDVAPLNAALEAEGLPVEVVGLGGLLDLPEVADVVAFCEVLDDPTANAALVRLLTGPRVRLGTRDLAALGRRAKQVVVEARTSGGESARADGRQDDGDALADAVAGVDPCDVVALSDVLSDPGEEVSAEGASRLAELAELLGDLRSHVGGGLVDLLHRVVTATGLDVELAANPAPAAMRRRENLMSFIDVAARYDDPDGENSLTSFLSFLRSAHEHERGLDVTGPSGSDAVQLMTVHKSKGLEWKVVAVPNLTRGVFPDLRVRGKWTTTPGVVPTPLRGDAADLPQLDLLAAGDPAAALAGFGDDCRDYQEREERRLAYVAFTRAKSVLVGSGHWWGPTQKGRRGPSPFLDELCAHANAGGGTVELWTPVPEEESNPRLVDPASYVWPVPYEPVAFARRVAAAAEVTRRLADLADERALPPDETSAMSARERALLAELDRDAALLLEEERRSRRPSLDVVLPPSLSASQLVQLRTDPAGLARDLARPVPKRPVSQARRGTRFHAWVEEVFDHRPLIDHDDLPGAADADLELGEDADLGALQRAFLASPYGGRRPYAVEEPFELPLAGRVLRGRIDAVYDLGGGRWEVVDWKTGVGRSDPVQLAVYRLAWARRRGVPPESVSGVFLYVRTGEVSRPALPDEAALARMIDGVKGGPI